jgi:hypothetical protein
MASKYNFSQDYEIIPPQKQRSYPISTTEWNLIKSKISDIQDNANIWHTIGSILIGTAIPSLITALSGEFKTEKALWICWGAFLITLITGAFAFFFGREQRKIQNKSKQDVVDFMTTIEDRYQDLNQVDIQNIVIQSAIYGANGQFVNVTDKISELIAQKVYIIKSGNELVNGQDPMVGTRKRLTIEYTNNGVAKSLSIPEKESRSIE